jgi:hypothetical protein
LQAVWCELYVAAEAKLSLMPKAQSILYPASFVVLFLVCATFLWPLGGGRVSAVEMPDLRSAPEPYVAVSNIYVAPDPPDISIGGFDRPKGVPDYEILQTERSERNGARGVTWSWTPRRPPSRTSRSSRAT